MRGKNREIAAKIEGLEKEIATWRARAYRMAGENDQLREAYNRVVADNRVLAEKMVDIATRPPTLIPAPQVDVAEILDGVRKLVQPEVIIRGDDSSGQVTNWSNEGLDNDGGVKEFSDKDVDGATGQRSAIPDYVLDIEKLTEKDIEGGKGGWYNPTPRNGQR